MIWENDATFLHDLFKHFSDGFIVTEHDAHFVNYDLQ